MANSSDRPTLYDVANLLDPNGVPSKTYEVLNQMNPIFEHAPAYPSNARHGNKINIRSALPSVTTVQVNKGIAITKGQTKVRTDVMGFFGARCEIDTKIREVDGDAAFEAEKTSQERGYFESFAQTLTNYLLYGDTLTDPAGFDGLMTRMPTLQTARTAAQVRSHGTVTGGDGTSILIVDWGEDGAHLIYPPGSSAGLKTFNYLNQPVSDVDGAKFQADVSEFHWILGVAVKDPRHIGRLANIDLSDSLVQDPLQGALIRSLIQLKNAMPPPAATQRVMYMHPDLLSAFELQVREGKNVLLSTQEFMGQPTMHFSNIPIFGVEQFSTAESTVS